MGISLTSKKYMVVIMRSTTIRWTGNTMLLGEKFSHDTPGCPKINLCPVIRITIEQFWSSVVPRRDVGDASSRIIGTITSRLSRRPGDVLVSVVVTSELFSAAEVTNLR